MTPSVIFTLQLTLILSAATLLAAWCGWGLARLALPDSLRPYSDLLAPAIGFALVVSLGYWGVRTVTGVAPPLLLAVALGGALNVAAWRRTGPPRAAAAREHAPLLALLALTLLVGIAPLLSYGHAAVIGEGWDTENYLPVARYLERGPLSAIASAPANPLRDINADPPRIGLTLGFSIWQAAVNLISGAEALATFAPMLAWLRALGVLTMYVLVRAVLGLDRWAALLACGWAAGGALLLWVSYFNFGMQLAAWPLIPLALTLAVAVVEGAAERSPRPGSAGLAALTLAALPIAYYPALTLFTPIAAGLGAALLLQHWAQRARLVASGLVIGVLATLIAAPTVLDYARGFSYRYGEQLTTLGLFYFIGPTDILGMTMFARGEPPPPPPPPPLLGAGLVTALMLFGALRGPQRARWAGVVLGTCAVMLWIRVVRDYPYAFMKLCAYSGWVFLGLAAAGWQALREHLPQRLRPLAIAPAILVAVPLAAGQAALVARHMDRPGIYAAELPALQSLRELVPGGSTVLLTSDRRVQGVSVGLAAYMLDHATVIGRVRTGYTSSNAGEPGELGDYGLLYAHEDPELWGYRDPIWRGAQFALFRRPSGRVAHLRVEHTLAPDERIALSLGDTRLALFEADLPGGEPRTLVLSVASLNAGSLRIGSRAYNLPAGVSTLRIPDLPTPSILPLHNSGGRPLLLRYAALEAGDAAGLSLTPSHASLVTRASTVAEGTTVTTTVQALLPDSGPLVAALDIWESDGSRPYGWYGAVLGVSPAPQSLQITLDMHSGAARAWDATGAEVPLGARFDGLRPGSYTARLFLGAHDVALIQPIDLFEFDVGVDGSASVRWNDDTPLLAVSTDRPEQVADALVGDDVQLYGYTLSRARVGPGEAADLLVWWRSGALPLDERSVLVHLLNAQGERVAQADGPPTGGHRPTSAWQPGEYIIDNRHIPIPADLPPGEYTIAIGMYRWPSLERLPMRVGGQRTPDDVLRIPIVVR